MNQDDILKWVREQIGIVSQRIVLLSLQFQRHPLSPAEMQESSLLQKDIAILQELERVAVNWYLSAKKPYHSHDLDKTVPVTWVDSCVTDLERQLDNLIPGFESCSITVVLRDFLTWMLERSGVKVMGS